MWGSQRRHSEPRLVMVSRFDHAPLGLKSGEYLLSHRAAGCKRHQTRTAPANPADTCTTGSRFTHVVRIPTGLARIRANGHSKFAFAIKTVMGRDTSIRRTGRTRRRSCASAGMTAFGGMGGGVKCNTDGEGRLALKSSRRTQRISLGGHLRDTKGIGRSS
jgi:hypothetical protein